MAKKMRAVAQPRPLDTCLGLAVWRHFAGQPYLVFVDELFRGFFEFDRRGYFVHAAVGIPEGQYSDLQNDIAPIFQTFQGLTSPGAREFKYSEFKRIDPADRRRMAFRLRDVLKKHGAFFAGFYTPLEAFVLERARTNLFLEDLTALPDDYTEVYKQAENELRAEVSGPGQSAVIAKLIHRPVVGVANMLASLDCRFRIIYDPGGKREDKAVAATVEGWVKLLDNLKNVKSDLRTDLADYILGFHRDRRSEDEVGLQLANLVAGEIREFFVVNQWLTRNYWSTKVQRR